MELVYKDKEGNIFKMKLDRSHKRMWEASNKTSMEYKETSWRRLFDQGKETIQDIITSKMSDKDFITNLSYWMGARYGYMLQEVIYDNP